MQDERVVAEHLDRDGQYLFAERDKLPAFFIVILQRFLAVETISCSRSTPAKRAAARERPIGRARHRSQRRHTVQSQI